MLKSFRKDVPPFQMSNCPTQETLVTVPHVPLQEAPVHAGESVVTLVKPHSTQGDSPHSSDKELKAPG